MSEIGTLETQAKEFIQNAETTIVDDVSAAGAWLMNELAKLEPQVLTDLKNAVLAAVAGLAVGGPGGAVADVLTALYADGPAVLASVSSDVVAAVVGLTAAKVPAPAAAPASAV